MYSNAPDQIAADRLVTHQFPDIKNENWDALNPSTWTSARDIAIDWTIVASTMWLCTRLDAWFLPLALIIVGNRQRALANLLHEASHRNLSSRSKVNDFAGSILLAAPLFSSLPRYRQQHARHHAYLGHPKFDPDFIAVPSRGDGNWFSAYTRVLMQPSVWRGSLFGHLANKHLRIRDALLIIVWWGGCVSLLKYLGNDHTVIACCALWMLARGTVFHAITVFREMTDHYGLEPNGIFRYTREIPTSGILSLLIHPHHNGYHLTHHLFPHIPYLHLPRAHAFLMHNLTFRLNVILCSSYIHGEHASTNGWGIRHE